MRNAEFMKSLPYLSYIFRMLSLDQCFDLKATMLLGAVEKRSEVVQS